MQREDEAEAAVGEGEGGLRGPGAGELGVEIERLAPCLGEALRE
jgi:hypothetical protein